MDIITKETGTQLMVFTGEETAKVHALMQKLQTVGMGHRDAEFAVSMAVQSSYGRTFLLTVKQYEYLNRLLIRNRLTSLDSCVSLNEGAMLEGALEA